MKATDSYIASMVNYYAEDRYYRNAKYDVYDYPEGKLRRMRMGDAQYFKEGRKINKKVMDEDARKMKEVCDK
jgi:hypothetical protein